MSQGAEAGSGAKSPPPELRGETFGRYRLIERIGAGGMAEIYKAVAIGEEGFERTVAIKRIRDEVGEVADIGKLFADEARLSAMLNHPNIVQVYDFGAVDGDYYIAMEYLKGHNLDEVLFALRRSGQRLEPALAVFVAHEVARALAYAHSLPDEQGRPLDIVHRDISPANVMLLQAGAVKLLDFGIARITSELRLAVTQGQALRGKCPYLAPEQITGGKIDHRSDIFALGVVLWEMLTGERLFAAESDLDSIANVLNRDIPAPSTVTAEVPAGLDAVVLAMLARDQEKRYASADVLANDLDEIMRTLPSRQRDLPVLLRRLFPPGSGELPTLPPAPRTPPRYEIELPTVAEGPRALRVSDARPEQGPKPASEVTAKITPVEARALAVRTTKEHTPPERVQRASGRRALFTVLGTLVGAELLAATVYRGFGAFRSQASSPKPGATVSVERCPAPPVGGLASSGSSGAGIPAALLLTGPATSVSPPWREPVVSPPEKRRTRRVRRSSPVGRAQLGRPVAAARKK